MIFNATVCSIMALLGLAIWLQSRQIANLWEYIECLEHDLKRRIDRKGEKK